ncbi:MAG: dihydroneopterin aldolase [Deltaproteobacteria bacterium]|nr:dihydroneopterin aldolase [Deltaproteobacteria bacterium]
MLNRLDKLSLTNMRVDCIVGVFANERQTPQPVELSLGLFLDTRAAATNSRIRETVDYARLAGELRFLLVASRFMLLESAAEAVAAYVLAPPSVDVPRPQVQRVEVKLVKPQALAGAGIPAIEIVREASDYRYVTERKAFGFVDVLFETKECGIYRERVAPGKAVPTHVHTQIDESELVLGDGLLLQGRRVDPGLGRSWPRGFAHRYDNPTATEQSFLCIDRPAFIPSDEVEVDVPTEKLSDVEPIRFFNAFGTGG